MGAFCFETVSYYVAQSSLNLDGPAASASLALGKFYATIPGNHATVVFSSKAGSIHIWLVTPGAPWPMGISYIKAAFSSLSLPTPLFEISSLLEV